MLQTCMQQYTIPGFISPRPTCHQYIVLVEEISSCHHLPCIKIVMHDQNQIFPGLYLDLTNPRREAWSYCWCSRCRCCWRCTWRWWGFSYRGPAGSRPTVLAHYWYEVKIYCWHAPWWAADFYHQVTLATITIRKGQGWAAMSPSQARPGASEIPLISE